MSRGRRLRSLPGLIGFVRDAIRFIPAARRTPGWRRISLNAKLHERGDDAGTMRGHYFHQDLLVAQRIFAARPRRHVDIGSRIDGFVAHVASYRAIEIMDLRPVASTASNISFLQADAMRPDEVPASICDSLSCLHVLEHFGLGRYGDELDPLGYERGFESLVRMLEPGGTLYLSVPIGPQKVLFNAHRRFHATTILGLADGRLELRRLDVVDDLGDLRSSIDLELPWKDPTLGCRREGCGIFEFRKPPRSSPR